MDSADNVYVADSTNFRIEKFSADGRLLAIFPQGQSEPISLAFGPRGALFVAEDLTNEVVKLSPHGQVLARWNDLSFRGNRGLTPITLAVGANGQVYVMLAGGIGGCNKNLCWDNRVEALQIYSPGGRLERSISAVSCDGYGGIVACSLHVAPDGTILLAGAGLFSIARFAAGGRMLPPWAGLRFEQRLLFTSGVAFDRQGNLYAAQGYANEISKFSPQGRFLASWGIAGNGPGQMLEPTNLAVSAAGTLAVYENGNNRIQELSATGEPLRRWPIPVKSLSYAGVSTIALDSAGNVYWVYQDPKDKCTGVSCSYGGIMKYSPTGHVLARWVPHLQPRFEPIGITTGPDDTLYVVDGRHRVVVFSASGRVLARWPTAADTDMVGGIAVGPNGRTYVSEDVPPRQPGHARIEVFVGGKHQATWTGLPSIGQLAVGPAGALYAASGRNDQVIKFSPTGRVWGRWGRTGYKVGHFNGPQGVAVNRAGVVYVADTGNDRIQERLAESAPR